MNNQPVINNRDQAIATIHQLMRDHHLKINDLSDLKRNQTSEHVTRVLSYLGTILILSGVCFFLNMQWGKLDSVLRVALTFGPGFIALIMAVVITKTSQQAYDLATPVFSISAFFQTMGLFVFLNEFSTNDNKALATALVTAVMSIQFLILFINNQRPALLLFCLIFAHFAFAGLFDLMEIAGRYSAFVLGLSGLLIATSLTRTSHAVIAGVGFVVSGFTLTTSIYTIFENTPYDVVMIAVAFFLLLASVRVQSRDLLFVSIISMIAYLGYYTDHYFKGLVSWPIALIIFGLIMIVIANYAIRLGQRFNSNR